MHAQVRNRDEQLAELNSALEELEDEKRRDMLAQQTQSHEQMRAVCVRLHQHYHHKPQSYGQSYLSYPLLL